ncbi:hypothetical protein [Pseudalkalibacillus berkeleyi]|uniref:Tetratricopeptide repeat protein n=1 Tax=Pseudalkalibacillus berkeleyi TaxID=1069813 RepID=A0ABS9H1H8_9BACL|nr:hypothetical protein [Pseudalkalibacillus berkeleyi]MCF6138842.1 hypothetical protein [Pseudalkalibacillus berkeleyi]
MSITVKSTTISERIDQWYEVIKAFHTEKAMSIKEELKGSLSTIEEDPYASKHYKLILFRYHLLSKDTNSAKEVLKDLEPFQETNELLQYYYYSFKGIYYYILNDYQDSIESFKKAQPYIIFTEHRDEIGEFHYKMAASYYELFKNALSIKHLESALTIFQKNYQYKRSADCELLLGLNLQDIKEFEEAEIHFHNALHYCDHFNDEEYKHTTLYNIGLFYQSQNYNEEAIQYFNKSRNYFVKENQTKYTIKATYQLAKLYYVINNVELAKQYQTDGLILTQKENDHRYYQKFQTLYTYSEEMLPEHVHKLLEALSFFNENKMWDEMTHLGEFLTNYYHKKQEFEEASRISQTVLLAKEKLYA